MSYFNRCPHCGDNLDPGEMCDRCKENALAAEPKEATKAKGVIYLPNKLHLNNTTKGGEMSSD